MLRECNSVTEYFINRYESKNLSNMTITDWIGSLLTDSKYCMETKMAMECLSNEEDDTW